MAEINHAFVEQNTNQTTTSSTFGDVSGLSIASGSFTAGKKYLIFATAQVVCSVLAGMDVGVRLIHGSTAFAESEVRLQENLTTNRQLYAWWTVWTAVSGEGIKMQFRNSDNTNTVDLNFGTILAINLSDNLTENTDWFYNARATDDALSTTPVNGATITFTPGTAGQKWLILTNMQDDPSTNTEDGQSRLDRSGEASSSVPLVGMEVANGNIAGAMFQVNIAQCFTLGAASNTFTEVARTDTLATHTRIHSQVFALNLSKFRNAGFAYTAGPTSLSTTNWATQLQTLSFTPDVTGNVWVGAFWGFGRDSATDYGRTRLQIGNSDVPAGQTTAAYQMDQSRSFVSSQPMILSTRANLSGTNVIDLDASCLTTTCNGQWSTIWAVTMELAAAAVSITPNTGALIITGQIPTVTTLRQIMPAVGALSLAPVAPLMLTNFARGPPTGSLALSGQSPTVATGATITITPATASLRIGLFGGAWINTVTGSLDLTGNPPTVNVSALLSRTPTTGILSIIGNSPTLIIPVRITPAAGVLAIAGLQPVLQVGNNVVRQPTTGTLSLTGQQPTISLGGGVNTPITPATGALRMTLDSPVGLRLVGYPPTVQVAGGLLDTPRTPLTGALVIAGVQPILQAGNNVVSQPSTGSLVLSGQQPLVSRAIIPATGALTITGNQAAGFTPAAGALAITGIQPIVQTGNNVIKQPSTGALVISGNPPNTAITITPATGSLALSGTQPGQGIVRTPQVGALVIAGQQPIQGRPVAPLSGALTLAGTVPSIFWTITPATGALVITGVQPILQVGNNVVKVPTTGSLALTGAAPDIQAGANVFKTPITGALAIGSVQAQVSGSITPNAGALAINGLLANVQASAHVLVTPAAGALAVQGFQSTTGGQIRPSTAVLSITGYAPNISQSIAPATGSLTLQGNQPAQGRVITPAAGSLTFTPQSGIASRGIVPSTGALNIAGVTPNLSRSIAPATGSLILVGGGPSQATTITPATGAMAVVGTQPALSAGIRTNTSALTITGGQPQIPVRLESATGSLSIGAGGWETAFAAPDFMPGTGSLNISGSAPTAFRPAFEFDAVLGGIDLDLQVSGEEGIILIVDDDVVI